MLGRIKLAPLGWLVFLIIAVLSFNYQLATAQQTLNLGVISDKSQGKVEKRYEALMEYLADHDMPGGKVIGAKSIKKMRKKLEAEEVDFFFETAYTSIRLMDDTGAFPLLIHEKEGQRTYQGVLFVKQDSNIQTPRDLQGKVVAFEHKRSTSSYLLPRSVLLEAELELEHSETPVDGKVAYYFTGNDDITIANVLQRGKAQAGGIHKGKLQDFSGFRILQPEPPAVPRSLVMVRKGVDANRLKEVLLEMKDSDQGKKVLKEIKAPTGFSEFEGDARKVLDTQVRKVLFE